MLRRLVFSFFFFAKVDNVKVLFSLIQNRERNMIIDDKRNFVRRNMKFAS